ncbi:MAG: hypothetical protein NT139_00320 [Candidatus Woesearchaeota archaeon]|nr:hypothetical protein [Candidatus Woesearchaeota archaeon]
MVRISIDKRRHLTALLFTILIFGIGILLGFILTDARISYVNDATSQQKLEYDSIQLQYLYISSLLKDENCPAITKALEENINNLENLRIKLENFMSGSENKIEYINLKREYTLAQLKYWLLSKQTKKLCKQDTVSVLFFYTNDAQCPDCSTQGTILTYLKDTFKDKLLIFSLDSNLNEPMVSILKETYNITKEPTTIIENTKFESLTTKEKLKEVICTYYTTKDPNC